MKGFVFVFVLSEIAKVASCLCMMLGVLKVRIRKKIRG